MPVISWGKLVDEKIPVSLTASHIFIFGWHFKLFYENLERYLNNPETLF
jgi:chloramphenicol O-acetyltransferase type A